MKKKINNLIGFLIVSIIGGLIAQQLVWPWLLKTSFFAQYKKEETPIHITEEKKIYIEENTALEEVVEKVEKSVIGVKSITKQSKVLEGSGLIITSDGLAITLAELVPQGSDFSFYVDGELTSYQILKRDLDNNLALIKLGKENLNTLSFIEENKIKLGKRVFLFGLIFQEKGKRTKVINEGIIRSLEEDKIKTSLLEGRNLSGSPLFDVRGNVLGLKKINEEGRVVTIPINKIKDFTGF